MFAAMASVALASCVKNEPAMTVAQQDEIAFDLPVMATPVKSVTETTAFADSDNFTVWGYITPAAQTSFVNQQLYMNGVKVTCQDGVWKAAAGKYYWPNNSYLTFVGYAPT